MTRILVTGASGFVGNILCPLLQEAGYAVRVAARAGRAPPPGVAEQAVVGEIDRRTDWTEALRGVELVIHLAARVHVLNDTAHGAAAFAEINAGGTARLASESARHGIRRFVYLSSVKVNGEESADRSYKADDEPRPQDAYGHSKWLAEQRLWETVASGPMQAVVVRPPLVYGSGVRANFLRLLHWVDQERLLPLGAVRNRRSLVSVWTLCDLLVLLLTHPAAANRTWMVSDGEDVSTPDLVRRIARVMCRQVRLISVPVPVLCLAGGLVGKGAEIRRLCGSLTLDIAPTRQLLGWSPPLSMDEALARTVSWYRSEQGYPRR